MSFVDIVDQLEKERGISVGYEFLHYDPLQELEDYNGCEGYDKCTHGATLDGKFTADVLRMIADAMDEVDKRYYKDIKELENGLDI